MIERGFKTAQQFAIQRVKEMLKTVRVIDSNKAAKSEAAPKIDLCQQTYDLLHRVRQPLNEEKEALGKRGIVFLLLNSKSYAQVVAEDPDYLWHDELNYANARPELRDYTLPVAVEAGFNPTQLALPDSFRKSRPVQLQMIEDYSQQLQVEFPDARAIMLPSTGYGQGDRAYKAATGEVLFRNFFAGALDNLSGVNAASAGRLDPSYLFGVHDWRVDLGNDFVAGVPAVVFVGNKM